uniref:Ternary complex factor MIP1 leucine-zipper domain-containing protein n=2 Tax=Oryza brachyantha TaxID=4533 RepID=J3MY89_ORYBR
MHTAPEMSGRARRPAAGAHAAKAAAPKSDRMMEKDQRKGAMPVKKGSSANAVTKGITNRIQARRERKLALQQDVDKLKKKLRHEENVHRALERAFTRPLGALPRLPPYLPSQTLALLAEVAVLEEEVVRLEEQVVNFRQGLYQEAIIFSSAKNTSLPGGEGCVPAQLMPSSPVPNSAVVPVTNGRDHHHHHHPTARPSLNGVVAGARQTPRKPSPSATAAMVDDRSGAGKENQSCSNTPARNCRHSPLLQKASKSRLPAAAPEKRRPAQTISTVTVPDRKRVADAGSNNADKASHDDSSVPNRLSEELLRCLLAIFSQMGSSSAGGQDEEQALSPSVSGSCESSEDAYPQDPYGILEFGTRDVGPYKRFHVIDATSFDQTMLENDTILARKLKALLRRLSSTDLVGLSHQQKLAFWINIYNSCMMNAFLEQGIPTTPHMLVAMMPKATINVGGRTHSAMSIEHFILRLPYSVKHVNPGGGSKGDDMTMRGVFGLEWPEPLVTFALSCGSWSSPAVRVYTAGRVEEELEAAKRDYLQAAVGVSAPAAKLAIPKLLHWYLLDFAKDVDSLIDWVCLQLPSELRRKAMGIVEDGRGVAAESRRVHVLPYEFRFGYLLAS